MNLNVKLKYYKINEINFGKSFKDKNILIRVIF